MRLVSILVTLVTLAALATSAAADEARLGKQKITITPCTIEGPALTLGEFTNGLAVTPDGALLALDGHADLHRYRVTNKGAACTLTPDRTFGKDGVLATGLPHKFDGARVSVDHAGAIYVDVSDIVHPTRPVRVAGGKVARMCAEGNVAASPASPAVWRWLSLDKLTRGDGTCAHDTTLDLSGSHTYTSGGVWPIDDRIVVQIGIEQIQLRDADGKRLVTLADADPSDLLAGAWAACGAGVCAAGEYAFFAWDAHGKRIGSFDTQGLAHATGQWAARGFATIGATGYLLGEEYTGEAPHKPAMIQRVDGL